jgi:RimJ/RimL family protein N-acetyltransferase
VGTAPQAIRLLTAQRSIGFLVIVLLTTPRLALTPLSDADAPDIARTFGHPMVMAALGLDRFGTDDARALIADHATQREQLGFAPMAARLADTGEFVGRIGLWWARHLHAVELGWVLHPDHWGRGLATEGAGAVLADARTRLGIDDVVSMIGPSNAASVAVAERLGATLRGLVPGAAGHPATVRLFEHAPGGARRWSDLPTEQPGTWERIRSRALRQVRVAA